MKTRITKKIGILNPSDVVRKDKDSNVSSSTSEGFKIPIETWVDIQGYEGLYKVSNYGQIKNRLGNILCSKDNGTGYFQTALNKRGKTKYFLTHRLVAQAFIKNPLNKPQINHKDNNPANNHVDNLEWVTSLENIHHTIKQGRKRYSANYYGEIPEYVSKVKALLLEGEMTQTAIAAIFGLDPSTVSKIYSGKSWKNA